MKYKRFLKDITQRQTYNNSEIVQRLIKILEFWANDNKSFFFFKNISKTYVNQKSHKTQIKNFCIYTGRSRAVLRHYKVSRIVFRELSSNGYFFGIKKAGW